jgi:polyisoprenoid-binding protein YceI
MRHSRLIVLAAAALLAAALPSAAAVSKNPKLAPNGTYEVDPEHTRIVFYVPHFGFTRYAALMTRAEGELHWSGSEPAASSVEVKVDAASIETGWPKFNDELRGDSWFDATANPDITFKSSAVEVTGDGKGRIVGDLTMRGVTKPVTLDVTFNGGGEHPLKNTYALGFSAVAHVKRSDWGMDELLSFDIGDDVEIRIEAEFLQEADD